MNTLKQVFHVTKTQTCWLKTSYSTTLDESWWQTLKGILYINHGVKYNNLYPLIVISQEGSLNITKFLSSGLWHGCLTHMLEAKLRRFSSLGYIANLQQKEFDLCEICQSVKKTHNPHSFHYEELIHTDICMLMLE